MKRFATVINLLFLIVMIFSCKGEDLNGYKTFIMDEGVIHFSLEYPGKYRIDSNKPAEAEGDNMERSAYFSLDGPLNRKTRLYTNIDIGVVPNDTYTSHSAKEAIEAAERQLSSWKGYELIQKRELFIYGYQAYRIDYEIQNIVPALTGKTEEVFIEVTRMVRFLASDYFWTIQISSDSSTAEEDKEDFEYILKTFKVLE